jgi:dTDP-glucose pyrophosphorylase
VTDQNRWKRALLPATCSLQDAIRNLDETALRIVLVIGDDGRLQGTVSDGDIRRSLLKGLTLNESLGSVLRRTPFVVPMQFSRDTVRHLMVANKIQQIPVVDESHRVIGLHVWDELSASPERDNLMVIMAGGKGVRLRPHTENCPKPLLPVAGRPMLEHIIERAKLEGFSRFVLAIHYLGYMIEDHFGDGNSLGVKIDYLREDVPLGTAGALSLLTSLPEEPFVVTNGDVLTDIRYGELLDFHALYDPIATMAVRVHEWQNPFGVVQIQGVNIVGIEEKPVTRSLINAGVYAISPGALRFLAKGGNCDMPTLFQRLKESSERIVAYPMHEPWLDVGRHDDLAQAKP